MVKEKKEYAVAAGPRRLGKMIEIILRQQ